MTSELDAGLTKGSYAFVTTTGGRAYHGQVENSTQRGFWLVGAAVVYETPLDHKSEPKRMFIAWDAVETSLNPRQMLTMTGRREQAPGRTPNGGSGMCGAQRCPITSWALMSRSISQR